MGWTGLVLKSKCGFKHLEIVIGHFIFHIIHKIVAHVPWHLILNQLVSHVLNYTTFPCISSLPFSPQVQDVLSWQHLFVAANSQQKYLD